jgi:hypothetical protein
MKRLIWFRNNSLATFATLTVLATALWALAPAASSASPSPDTCGVILQSAIARALYQHEASEQKAVQREPGNSAGVIEDRCTVLAWTGAKPSAGRHEREALIEGNAANLKMEAWVTDAEGPSPETWRANFSKKIDGLTAAARRAFVQGGHRGEVVALPRFGAEHSLGFTIVNGGAIKLRAFWWDAGKSSIVAMNIAVAKNASISGAAKSLAKIVVPAIG